MAVAALVVTLIVSGCAAPEPHRDDDIVSGLVILKGIPNRPIVINETVDPGTFAVVLRSFGETCMFDPYPAWSYKLFDRHGLVAFQLLEVDPHVPESSFKIPLVGEPPYLFVGDGHGCTRIFKSETKGVVSGYEMLDAGFSTNDSFHALETENITLARGERKVSVPWAPGPLVWDLEGGVVEIESAEGFVGAIRVLYPDGSLWAEKRFGTGSPSGSQPLHYQPGDYTIEAEADVAAVNPVVFRYSFASLSLDERVCLYGFEWDICGE